MRPATPGFIVTLLATILLAIVSFSVPWFKFVYFLKASLSVGGTNGTITFGVLGYCVQLSNGTTCSKPSIGYELDINKLVGDKTSIQIPQVAVKWITYALFLHVVALILASISSVFGLLAHVREFSMSCLSTCISGLGAVVTLLAFIFDLTFFFLAKSRINSVKGASGSATMGNAIWLTFTAWLLLFFAGCFYSFGRCCIRRRPRDMAPSDGGRWLPAPSSGPTYEEQMRLDAVKAEADRKARKQTELGLPSFPEYDPTQPLTGDAEYETSTTSTRVPYRDAQYAAAPVGTRAVDEYYTAGNNAYPPRRQPTGSSGRTQQTGYVHSQQTSGYAPSNYSGPTAISTGPPAPYLNADNTGYQASTGYGHEQYASNVAQRRGSEHYGNVNDYGRSTTPAYNVPPARVASNSSSTDPFRAYTSPQTQPPLNTYNATARFSPPQSTHPQPYNPPMPEPASPYYTPQAQTAAQSPPYAVGGGGYGDSTAPALPDPRASANSGGYLPYPGEVMTPSSGSVYTGLESPPAGRLPSPEPYEDSPPMYDEGPGIGHTNTGPSHTTAAPRPRKR